LLDIYYIILQCAPSSYNNLYTTPLDSVPVSSTGQAYNGMVEEGMMVWRGRNNKIVITRSGSDVVI